MQAEIGETLDIVLLTTDAQFLGIFEGDEVYTGVSALNPIQFDTGITARFDGSTLTISAVPIPAAVWLFGSACIGLFGLTRRKNQLLV